MNKHLVSVLFALLSLSALSQNTTIYGKADGQPDKLVRIIVYSDQFSNLEKTIAETRTNGSGEFFLQANVKNTMFAYLALNLEKGEFYITPGATYNINIIKDTTSEKGSIFDKLPLNFTIEADDGDIQKEIENFNITYNEFIYNNINSIYKSRNKSAVTQFVSDMQKKYTNGKTDYVNSYITYSLAQLLWLSKKENNRQILNNYFINKPVLYNNIQYTDFFKEFFKSYFSSAKIYSYEELIYAINSRGSIESVDTLLARDESLRHDSRVREIVDMLLLSRNYYNRDVNKKQVISKLNDIATKSEFDSNRLIAKNYVVKLQELQNGSPAPKFALSDINDSTISLDDFIGKFVLLDFVKPGCKICDFHMELLNDIKQQNNNAFDIVTIIAGDELNRLVNFSKERDYNWAKLKTGKNILLLEDYNIKAYPSYIFINPDGTIAYAHLPMPDENMELYLQRFMKSYNSKK